MVGKAIQWGTELSFQLMALKQYPHVKSEFGLLLHTIKNLLKIDDR